MRVVIPLIDYEVWPWLGGRVVARLGNRCVGTDEGRGRRTGGGETIPICPLLVRRSDGGLADIFERLRAGQGYSWLIRMTEMIIGRSLTEGLLYWFL